MNSQLTVHTKVKPLCILNIIERGYKVKRQRKTDKYKLKENRGTGRGLHYQPWIKPHEFSSRGRPHRVTGWKNKRMYVFLSDLEFYYFLILQWNDAVVDIREQFPLLPLEHTKAIAERLSIRHSAINRQQGEEVIMTTDFLITIKEGNTVKDIARTVKMAKDLSDRRVREKFLIEKEYWKSKGYEWGIITELKIDKVFAMNLWFLYQDYLWDEYCPYSLKEIDDLTSEFKLFVKRSEGNALKMTSGFESLMGWEKGMGLNFLKYLIIKKKIKVDLTKRLNFDTLILQGEHSSEPYISCK